MLEQDYTPLDKDHILPRRSGDEAEFDRTAQGHRPHARFVPGHCVRNDTSKRRVDPHIQFTKEKQVRTRRSEQIDGMEKDLKNRIAAAVAAVVLGAAPVTSALAFSENGYSRPVPTAPGWTNALGAHDGPRFTACPMSSAAEGNANQQNFPVKQYGQTAGGYRC